MFEILAALSVGITITQSAGAWSAPGQAIETKAIDELLLNDLATESNHALHITDLGRIKLREYLKDIIDRADDYEEWSLCH